MNRRHVILCALAGAALLPSARAAVLENAGVRIETTQDGRTLRMSVSEGWVWWPALESIPDAAAGRNINTLGDNWERDARGLHRVDRQPGRTVTTVISLGTKPGHVRVVSRVNFASEMPVEAILGRWRFLGGVPDATWTPNLTPEPDQVIGQHAFRSPAVVVQKDRLAALLLPNLDSLAQNPDNLPATLNLDVKAEGGPILQMALQPHQVQRHVYWRHEPGQTVTARPGDVTLSYDILLTANAEPRRAYRLAARWWWNEEGRNHLLRDTLPQAVPWKRYVEVGYDDYLPLIWRETEMNGETVGGAAMSSWGYANATWFQCWFNDLRSAYGQYLWGKWTNRPGLVDKARKTRQLLLNAPQKDGLFPAIYDWNARKWNGSTAGGGTDIYHTADNAWAAYWLLKWHRDLEKDPASVAFARRLGDGLIRLQKPSGEIPSFIRMDTMQPVERLVGGAETSGSGMFLSLLARTTGEAKYMEAAKKAAEYIRREIMPRNKWHDYETFYSCSSKPEDFYDTRTDQNPQNNLSIHWAAEMFRQLYLANQRPADLADGEALMDYLNLYQQSWAPTFLTFEGFGGYGVQNTDAEWNDARQAQFACTNLDYYRLTGKPEYMERGIAAMRAGFATTYMPENAFISPLAFAREPLGHADENYGHGGVDSPAGPTGWDWGTGSALAAVAYARRAFGDVWVDADGRRAFGINGVTATLHGDRLDIRSSAQTVAPVLVRGTGKALPVSLSVNGKPTPVSAARWRDGFLATPATEIRIRHRAPKFLTVDNAAIEFEVWPGAAPDASVVAGVTVAGKRVVAERVSDIRWRAILPVSPSSSSRQRVAYDISANRSRQPVRDGDWPEFVRASYATRIVSFGPESDLWTERFTGTTMTGRWQTEIPTPGATVRSGENGLTFNVPGGRAFDQWVPQNDAPRVMTAVPEGDWSFTARLDMGQSPQRGNYQAGIAVELGNNDFALWGPHQGTTVMLERSGMNGLGASRFDGPMPRELDLRARRLGDTLWFDWRPAGGAWRAPVLYRIVRAPRRAGMILKTWEAMPAQVTVHEARMATMAAD